MTRFHVFRNLRSAAFMAVLAALVAAAAGLWWANRTGLPESWRAAIEREAAKQGAHVTIGGLTYVPFVGITASDLRVFADEEKTRELGRLERIVVALDKTKLARGIVRLMRIELSDARMILPVDPDDPESPALEITGLHGTASMPGGRLMEFRGVRGRIGGIDVEVDGRMLGKRRDGKGPKKDPDEGARRELLARVIDGLEHWDFAEDVRPTLRVRIEGDVSDRSSIVARMEFRAPALAMNGRPVEEVAATAELRGNLLNVTSLRATDERGVFDGRLDYDLHAREGRFDIHSTLDAIRLSREWLELPELPHVVVAGTQALSVEGDFRLPEDAAPEVEVTGSVRCSGVMARGVSFDSVESLFSWRDGELYLRDILAVRPDGELRGKLMHQPPFVRLALGTTLPARVWQPFFQGQPLGWVLGNFAEGEGAAVRVTLDGGFDTTDPRSWAFAGSAAVENMSYQGVPVHSAECRLALSSHELDFFDGTVVFDYTDYPMRREFGGPASGTGKVGRIRYESASRLVTVEAVAGRFWPEPMVRFFAPAVADGLKDYRFHRPPRLAAEGAVDVTRAGRTKLDVSFASEHQAAYELLGKPLTLRAPAGNVRIRGGDVAVRDLRFGLFDGPVEAAFLARGGGRLEGELSWSGVSLPELAAAGGGKVKAGELAGRLEFSIDDGDVRTMQGRGLLSMTKGELFSVPIFGPLSPVVAGVLGDRRAGFERAKDAFCGFTITDGILTSHDFHTVTSSLVFTGEGSVDLADRTVDMIVRMNARGFLGLITLPLRPFYGLFQFRGTGPLADPEWDNVRFTSPPEAQNELLLTPPPRAEIVPLE